MLVKGGMSAAGATLAPPELLSRKPPRLIKSSESLSLFLSQRRAMPPSSWVSSKEVTTTLQNNMRRENSVPGLKRSKCTREKIQEPTDQRIRRPNIANQEKEAKDKKIMTGEKILT